MIKEILSRCAGRVAGDAWMHLCRNESREFFAGTADVASRQENLLLSIIEKNRDTSFGIKHGFCDILTVEDYQQKVPLSLYADYEPYIDKIASGEKNVLTSENVLMFELSSGSTSASKYIPYTAGFKEEFQRGLKIWLYDMAENLRGLFHGTSYWSVSPVADRTKRTDGGVPVGFEEDSEYFGKVEQVFLRFLFAVPGEVKHIGDIHAFRYITLLFLLKSKRLSFISVWNPTFLTLLFENFHPWFSSLIADIKIGKITPPAPIDMELLAVLEKRLGKNPSRAKELNMIRTKYKDAPDLLVRIWPHLSLISCWTSSHAKAFIPDISRLFPKIAIQGKGLLATECFVSLPVFHTGGSLLSYRSHFFEFIELNEGGGQVAPVIKTAAELEEDRIYSVVVTTSGGFYRYQMQDLVACRGYHESCPIIEFLGKADKVSDYFGEKLNEFHISSILEKLFASISLSPALYMAAPEEDGRGNFFYVLYIDADVGGLDNEILESIISAFEYELRKNYHYDYCRKLGQLEASKLFFIDEGTGISSYIEACRLMGQRTGDIKPAVLHTKTGWSKRFKGRFM